MCIKLKIVWSLNKLPCSSNRRYKRPTRLDCRNCQAKNSLATFPTFCQQIKTAIILFDNFLVHLLNFQSKSFRVLKTVFAKMTSQQPNGDQAQVEFMSKKIFIMNQKLDQLSQLAHQLVYWKNPFNGWSNLKR